MLRILLKKTVIFLNVSVQIEETESSEETGEGQTEVDEAKTVGEGAKTGAASSEEGAKPGTPIGEGDKIEAAASPAIPKVTLR